MTFRLIALPLCSGLLILAAMTDTQAGAKHKDEIDVLAWSWGTNKKPNDNGKGNKATPARFRSNTSDRIGGGGGRNNDPPRGGQGLDFPGRR